MPIPKPTLTILALLTLTAGATTLYPTAPRITTEPQSARRALIAHRNTAPSPAIRARDNATLAHTSLTHALAAHAAWLTRRNPTTHLFPQSPTNREWNYHNTAADFFCFEYALAHYANLPSLPLLQQTLTAEAALCGPNNLCRPFDSKTLKPHPADHYWQMFGTSEYMKDGLIGLYERTADPAVLTRLTNLANTVIASSQHQSTAGPIPSDNTEINGNILQVFPRLSYITNNPTYAEHAAHIADAIILQMFPRTNGLPATAFNYTTNTPTHPQIQLRDHGNEAAVGLAEIYAFAAAHPNDPLWQSRERTWREPLLHMYETLLTRGIAPSGLLVNQLDSTTLTPIDPNPCDNWGYLLSGALLFTQAAQRTTNPSPALTTRLEALTTQIDTIALAVTHTDNLAWEGTHPDGFADTIESAIYLANHRPHLRDQLLNWADDQLHYMLAQQSPTGFTTNDYLDGNFIRTLILHAEARTGGFRLAPFSTDVQIGLADTALSLTAGPAGYSGQLLIPQPRHTTVLHLPWNWPRVNSWPEWPSSTTATPSSIPITLAPYQTITINTTSLNAATFR